MEEEKYHHAGRKDDGAVQKIHTVPLYLRFMRREAEQAEAVENGDKEIEED